MGMARRLFLVCTLALAGCVVQNPELPTFASAERSLLPPASGMARLYFYRLLEPSDPALGTMVMLNQQPVGFSRNGTVLYRDVTPGTYFVSVLSRGQYPFQFKTVQVQAGQVWYFRIESLASWAGCNGKGDCRGDTFVVAIVDPAQARVEIAPLGLLPG
ncbi:MAG: DUF2846 domain-containing protein [Alphaproteobacteria bacterium]|nr:DUF2846 domain-containing protein [Alphaproteobacteria bacterium]